MRSTQVARERIAVTRRKLIEDWIDHLIDLLDTLDGNPDDEEEPLEMQGDREPNDAD